MSVDWFSVVLIVLAAAISGGLTVYLARRYSPENRNVRRRGRRSRRREKRRRAFDARPMIDITSVTPTDTKGL